MSLLAVRRWLETATLVAVAIWGLPAAAQQAADGRPTTLSLPVHPADTGKPMIYDPQFVGKSDEDGGCAPGFACRLRLFGVIQNNGAVELRATAFTW